MKNYWWIVSIVVSAYVGGESPDGNVYPTKEKEVFKLFGIHEPKIYESFCQEISKFLAGKKCQLDFVWCLGENGTEEPTLAGTLSAFLKEKLSL